MLEAARFDAAKGSVRQLFMRRAVPIAALERRWTDGVLTKAPPAKRAPGVVQRNALARGDRALAGQYREALVSTELRFSYAESAAVSMSVRLPCARACIAPRAANCVLRGSGGAGCRRALRGAECGEVLRRRPKLDRGLSAVSPRCARCEVRAPGADERT